MNEPKRTTDDWLAQVQTLLRELKPADTTEQMEASREEVYSRIVRKAGMQAGQRQRVQHSVRRFAPVYEIAVSVVLLLSFSFIAYTYLQSHPSDNEPTSVEWKAMYTPKGKTCSLTLADGTTVTLNIGSSLIYPTSFTGGRQVFLQGEAFFDVEKTGTPFTVQSHLLTIDVLGTRFSLKSYDEEEKTVLTLESGSVKATPASSEQSIVLQPRQQLVYDGRTRKVECQEVTPSDYTAWKEGILVFRDQTIAEIASVLERQFDVRIEIASERLRNERYNALFKHGESLQEILDKLSQHRPWRYVMTNGTIRIAPS